MIFRPLIFFIFVTANVAFAQRDLESFPTWAIGGFVVGETTLSYRWLVIEQGKIQRIVNGEPQEISLRLKTNDYIFPGLIDMHNHLEYNILPLWELARGQFVNRFEWRQRYDKYKEIIRFNMQAFDDDALCLASKYAELKAITGGVTTIQGATGQFCGKGFAVRNVESSRDLQAKKAVGIIDTVKPFLVGKVYLKEIKPLRTDDEETYDDLYAKFLKKHALDTWLNNFVTWERTFENGLKLLLGPHYLPVVDERGSQKLDKIYFLDDGVKIDFKTLLARLYEKKIFSRFDRDGGRQQWNDRLYGLYQSFFTTWLSDYLKPTLVENIPCAKSEAAEFIHQPAVIIFPEAFKAYINEFEEGTRQRIKCLLENKGAGAVFTHLAEGRHDDSLYNNKEYQYLQEFGLTLPGMVLIHGTGMTDAQLRHAAEQKSPDGKKSISLVWSPFSNLLLYGQTLNVALAKELKLNITLGADWSLSGSKTLLDELKIAYAYLQNHHITQISKKDLFKFVTTHAAKALGVEKTLGKLAKGYHADFFVLKKESELENLDAALDALLDAAQEQITLVSIAGRPLYGERTTLGTFVEGAQELPLVREKLEGNCDNLAKAFYWPNELDAHANTLVDLVASLEKAQSRFFASQPQAKQQQRLKIDFMYNCAHSTDDYDSYTQRLKGFISGQEIDRNESGRTRLRRSMGFDWDVFDPTAF